MERERETESQQHRELVAKDTYLLRDFWPVEEPLSVGPRLHDSLGVPERD